MPKLLKQIKNEMKKLPRDPRDYKKLPISKLESRPSPGINSITYKSVVKSESPSQPKGDPISSYITFVQFFDVEFKEKKSKKFTEMVEVGGKILYHPKPAVTSNRVNLKCQCTDFRFVWEFPLFENKALIGRFRKYTRVPGSNRPPRNPEDLMGLCKHVWSMLNALNAGKIIKETNKL